jgi:small subunit ribosomal protein S8
VARKLRNYNMRLENLPKTKEMKASKRVGIAIISTSEGLMTDKEARAKGLGGEVLAYIW